MLSFVVLEYSLYMSKSYFYSHIDDVLYAVNSGGEAKVQGFTINPNTGKIIASWSPHGQV